MRLWSSRTSLVVVSVAIAAALTAPAAADEPDDRPAYSDEDVAAARALFEAGVSLLAAGNFEDACRTFKASLDRVDGLGTRGKLAECYEKLGRIASAWKLYRNVRALARDRDDKLRERVAAERLRAIEPRLPFLSIDVSSLPADTDLAIQDNGEAIPRTAWNTEQPIDPGVHYIAVLIDQEFYWARTVEMTETMRLTLTVPAPDELEDDPPVDRPPPEDREPKTPSATTERSLQGTRGNPDAAAGSGRRAVGLGVIGVGAALLVAGGVFTSQALSKRSEAREAGCDDDEVCTSQLGFDLINDARSKGDTATTTIALGVVAVTAGAVLWWTGRQQSRDAASESLRVMVSPTPDGTGLVISGAF